MNYFNFEKKHCPLCGHLLERYQSKIDNEKTSKYITEATTIVLDAVKCVFQTHVEALKKRKGQHK